MIYRKQIFVFAISFLAGVFFLLANAELGYSGMVLTGACCLSDGSCQDFPSGTCEDAEGTYNGDGTTCSSIMCPQPGACCHSDGSCNDGLAGDCDPGGGNIFFAGSLCSSDPCPPTGACCMGGIDCDDTFEANCGDSYQGDGTSCGEANICTATGACCFGDGTCDVLPETECADQKGGYQGNDTPCDDSCAMECPVLEQTALKCYKVKDLDASYNEGSIQNLVVQLTGIFQFGKETCKIVGNYREFCFPVDVQIEKEETVLDAVDSGLIDPRVDRVCYEIRNCDESEAELPDTVTINDEVGGTRKIIFKEGRKPPAPSTLCMPAEKCNPDCAKGEETCELQLDGTEGITSQEGICHGCRCVPAPTGPTGCCLSETSCDQVTEQDCPDDSSHEFIANGNCTGLQCAVEIP